MTTYNTRNPLGSQDPRDLFDNAQNMDHAANSLTEEEWIDRFGKSRKTWNGIEKKANFDIATAVAQAVEVATAEAETYRDEALDARDDAKAAAGAIGPIKFYSTYADALSDIAGIPVDGLVEISQDETHAGARTRYFKRLGNVLEFAVNLDQLRIDLIDIGAGRGAGLVGFKRTAIGAASRTVSLKIDQDNLFTLEDFGAIGDGTLHPLSERYASIELAQFVFPSIVISTLDESIDSVALRTAFKAIEVGKRGGINLTPKSFVINTTVTLTGCAAMLRGSGIQSSNLIFTNGGLVFDNSAITSTVRKPIDIYGVSILAAPGVSLGFGVDFRGARSVGYNVQFSMRDSEVNGVDPTGKWTTPVKLTKASQSLIDGCQIGAVSTSNRVMNCILLDNSNDVKITNNCFHAFDEILRPTNQSEGIYFASNHCLAGRDGIVSSQSGNMITVIGNHFALGRNCIDIGGGSASTGSNHCYVAGNFAIAWAFPEFSGDIFTFSVIGSDNNITTNNQVYNEAGKTSYVYRTVNNTNRSRGPTNNIFDGNIGIGVTKIGIIGSGSVNTKHLTHGRDGVSIANEVENNGTNTTFESTNGGVKVIGNTLRLQTPGVSRQQAIEFCTGGNDEWDARIVVGAGGSGNYTSALQLQSSEVVARRVRPSTDNAYSLGEGAFRYSTVYAATGAINTSDARDKTEPLSIDDAVLDAWGDVQLISFQWLKSVIDKGDLARLHFGVIAQQVRDAFSNHGLDGVRYGLLCYDKWDEIYEPVLETRINQDSGEEETYETGEQRLVLEAGDRWGIRPDQCLFLEAAFQRRRSSRIEARLQRLEDIYGLDPLPQ